MHLEKGVLLQHIGFPSRSHIKSRIAEITGVDNTEVTLMVDGDVDPRSVKRFDLLRWWEELPYGEDVPPSWMCNGARYRARDQKIYNSAIIMTAHPGWVSFHDQLAGHPEVFRIVPLELFKKHWEPDARPTAWAWILEDA